MPYKCIGNLLDRRRDQMSKIPRNINFFQILGLSLLLLSQTKFALSADASFQDLEDKKYQDYGVWEQDLASSHNDFTITLGYLNMTGNSEKLSHSVNVNYVNHHDKSMEHAILQYSNLELGTMKQESTHAKFGYAIKELNDFHFLINGRYDKDNYSGYDNRISYGVGVARVISSEGTSRLTGILSVDNNGDKPTGKARKDYLSSTLSLMYTKVFNEKFSVTNSTVFSKALSTSSYYYDIDTKISYRIGSNWSLSANYDFLHRSETLGGAYKDTDTRLTLGLTYHR